MNNYLSVSEYARLNGKDPGNIRRLLMSGRLEGQKIGNQWVISKDSEYPKDRRESTGKYRNWRKRTALNQHKDLMKSIKSMIVELKNIYGDLLSEVILYGSYARGTQTEESDVDIAIILSDIPSRETTNKMIDCVAYHEIETNKVLSVIDIDRNKYSIWKENLPFYKNIEKEGIVLWNAAV